MEGSMMGIKQILTSNGFSESDIIVIKGDNIVCNALNYPCGTLRNVPNDPESTLVNDLFEIDYSHEDNYPEKILEVFTGRYNSNETNYRR